MTDQEKLLEQTQEMTLLNNSPELQGIVYEQCRRNVKYWLWGDTPENSIFSSADRVLEHTGLIFVYTLDEHDKDNPIKPFPRREYFLPLIDLWQKEQIVLLVKSAKMMITWLFVALYLHDTMFNLGRHNFFQSQKEEAANFLIDRAKFIYSHQPHFLKQHKIRDVFGKLEFDAINSKIWGVPQGPDQIREYTPSGILSDEMAFQVEAEASYTASRPNITGGGRFTGITRPNRGFFHEMIKDVYNPRP